MIFNLTSSIIYIFNDINDVEYDRRHPVKKKRPYASKQLSIVEMYSLMSLLAGLVLIMLGFLQNTTVSLIILGYAVANYFYTKRIKHIPYLDILLVACFMGLRVLTGFVLVGSPIEWTIVMLIIIFVMFYLLLQRVAEMELIQDMTLSSRPALRGYSKKTNSFLLTLLMMVSVLLYFMTSAVVLPELIYTDILFFGFTFSLYNSVVHGKKQKGIDGLSVILNNRQAIVIATLLVLVIATLVVWTRF